MAQTIEKIALALVALLAGVNLVFHFKKRSSSNTATQSGNIVGGDQAGRDIHK